MCLTGTALLGIAAVMASPAGLSCRWPWATAHFMTVPIRRLTFRAVSCLLNQIGVSAVIASAVVTLSISVSPKCG